MKKYQFTGAFLALSLIVSPILVYGQVREQKDNQRPNQSDNENAKPIIMPYRVGTSTPKVFSSTTRQDIQENIRQQIDQKRNEINDNRKELRVDIFKLQQNNITRQLERSLENLKQVSSRISARITKAEQSGKTMTSAKALLVIAEEKMTAAETAVALFVAYSPTASSTIASTSTAATSTNIQLDKPRQVASTAITAIKSAKDALNAVVVSIAQDMGINLSDSPISNTENK
ncbi:MAG: hypothetical protein WCO48_00365 [Candidatus Taylorbacteria bacterium]